MKKLDFFRNLLWLEKSLIFRDEAKFERSLIKMPKMAILATKWSFERSLFLIVLLLITFSIDKDLNADIRPSSIVMSSMRIEFDEFPEIMNPSIVEVNEGILLTFRYWLAPAQPWISYIGIVLLDKKTLQPIGRPQLLNTRNPGDKTSSQSEDARIFLYNDEPYIIYNDVIDIENPTGNDRRDMFIAKVNFQNGLFSIDTPIKLSYPREYRKRRIQKNWFPFQWKDQLFLVYKIHPHEVIVPDLETGECFKVSQTPFKTAWNLGELRGGTPAELVDGEYLAFFHTSFVTVSEVSRGIPMFHYYMGAYVFSSEPPFTVKKSSTSPIVGKGFYTPSNFDKRVIFPGGFINQGSTILLAYGKDDREVWLAVLNKKKLMRSLKPVRRI